MEMDKADREQIIQVPVLALWGKDGVVGKLWDVMSGWQERAANVEGFAVNECGHFVPEMICSRSALSISISIVALAR